MELAAPARAFAANHVPACRFCGAPLTRSFADLGLHPPCQSIVRLEDADMPETVFPLHARVCDGCSLVQIPDVVRPEDIFSEYAYFSSFSDSWVAHARRYVTETIARLSLGPTSMVVELASNDGYLLQHFVARGVQCLGVEPAANVAEAALKRGVPTRVAYFNEDEARRMVAEGIRADLLVGNNVLAHTPDLNGFVAGLKILLTPAGTLTMEFPHLMRLVEGVQFDTIYHEHYSYFSLTAVQRVFAAHGLAIHDVEELPTHGGSLRIHASHAEDSRPASVAAKELSARERAWGVDTPAPYEAFADRVRCAKLALLDFLVSAARQGKQVVGYGAAGKGNTLLNACGIRPDLLRYVVDRNPYKQHTLLPGSRIPVYPTATIYETRPDYVLILPWNLRSEISAQMAGVREWGGRFVVPIPEVEVF
jgi:hypothetical protein